MIYYYYFVQHPEEYEPYKFDMYKPRKNRVPKANCSLRGLHSLYRWEVESEDEFVVENPKEVCKRMVDKFKASECYKFKSEEERKEIIDFLSTHPEPEYSCNYPTSN